MSKLTGWYPPHIKPVRKGVYDVADGIVFDNARYKFWNGKEWAMGSPSPRSAFLIRDDTDCLQDQFHWRGLARRPK